MNAVSSVSSVSSVSTYNLAMEVWKMSMTQRTSHELRQRVVGKEHRHEHPKVEPAARVTISPEAKRISQG